ncbi:MAG: hypothetical protein WA667_08230, partial [Candidatus Nitrosopolaris sp.]
ARQKRDLHTLGLGSRLRGRNCGKGADTSPSRAAFGSTVYPIAQSGKRCGAVQRAGGNSGEGVSRTAFWGKHPTVAAKPGSGLSPPS